MTVALIVLDGVRAADRLHLRIAKSLAPAPSKTRGRAALEKWYEKHQVHFVDMDEEHKLMVGNELGKANITAFIAGYWHTEESTTHEHRFAMYKQLVKTTTRRAFWAFDDLVVAIAKQGGWDTYGRPFMEELRQVPDEFISAGIYRKGAFFLSSPAKPGPQIADFYASSSRSFLLAETDASLAAPYELIQHQVRHFERIGHEAT
jgi:hypothetical protein